MPIKVATTLSMRQHGNSAYMFPCCRLATHLSTPTQNHVREHLVEESIAADKPLKEFLGWVEARKVYLQDTPWFKNHWPEGILMRCVVLKDTLHHMTRLVFLDLENAHGINALSTVHFKSSSDKPCTGLFQQFCNICFIQLMY